VNKLMKKDGKKYLLRNKKVYYCDDCRRFYQTTANDKEVTEAFYNNSSFLVIRTKSLPLSSTLSKTHALLH